MDRIPLEKQVAADELADKIRQFLARGGKVHIAPLGATGNPGPMIRGAEKARGNGTKKLTKKRVSTNRER